MSGRIDMVLARCSLVLTNALSKIQSLQVRLLRGELKDHMEHFEPYGFTSHAHPGAEGVAAFFNGDRSHGVVLCIADRRFRLHALEAGEVALYTDEGDRLHFRRNRVIEIETVRLKVSASDAVEFDTPLITTTGRIESEGDQVAGGVSQINHPHKGVRVGSEQSGPPVAGGA